MVRAHKRGYCVCYGVKVYAIVSGISNAPLSNQEFELSYRIKNVTDQLYFIPTRLLPLPLFVGN